MFFVDAFYALIAYLTRIYTELPAHTATPLDAGLFLFFSGGWVLAVVFALVALEHLWVEYLEEKWEHGQTYVMLAIDVPRLNEQSPKGMENVFSAIWGAGGKLDFIEKYVIGKGPNKFSFEISSAEGHLQFYVRCRDKSRDLVEAALFSQYPNAEIQEVEDYVKAMPKKWPNEEYDMTGCELTLTNPYLYPIKTYPFFEHTLSGELKDPFGAVIETMNKLGPNEHLWFQIAATPGDSDWKKDSEALIGKIAGQPPKTAKNSGFFSQLVSIPVEILTEVFNAIAGVKHAEAKKEEKLPRFILSPLEKEVLDGLSVKASKVGFKSKVRIVYIAKKGFSKGGARIGELTAALQGFSSQNLNSFKRFSPSSIKSDYPWHKQMWAYWLSFGVYRPAPVRMLYLFHGYKHRSIVRQGTPYILSSEELASIWHFPTLEIKSPLLRKIDSKRAEAPFNVPIKDELKLPGKPAMMPVKHGDGGHGHDKHDDHDEDDEHGKHESAPEEVPPNLPFA